MGTSSSNQLEFPSKPFSLKRTIHLYLVNMRSFVIFILFSLINSASFGLTNYEVKVKLIKETFVTKSELYRWQGDVLYPHLAEKWLSKNIQKISQRDVDKFLNDSNNNAAAWFFRSKWRSELVRRQDWRAINQSFKGFSDPSLVCHYLQSQKELGQHLSYEKIESLWLSGQSRPDHCDPFFKQWIDSLENPDPIVWQRQIKAFYSRNGTLLRYLDRFYEQDESKALSQFLITVYSEPKQLVSKRYDPNSKQMHEIALAAVNRMAFQDPRSASNLWQQVVKATPNMSHQEIKTASRYLGIAMAKLALPEASYWLAIADPKKEDETVQHWRLQIALTQRDYASVLQHYQSLSTELKGSNQWRYWYGIAQLKKEGTLSPNNPLISLSTKRLYYGYLAAGVLGKPASLNADPNYPKLDTQHLSQNKSIVRAKALFEVGEIRRAQVEWNLFIKKQDNATQHAAALIAMNWGWYAKASQSAGWSGRYDLIDLRYPIAFGDIVQAQTQKLSLPRYWVYGVMRQESRYEHTAVSPAGALGLMQVMPNTAKVTARKHQIPYQASKDLHDPQTNITIGTYYLRDLMNRFDHPVYATAAYNAGPSRVDTWRERFPRDMTIWIESIPFDETRNYVKSVLAYSQIYALKTNVSWHLSSWTQPNEVFAQSGF